MSNILARLSRKSALTDDDIARIAAAVAGHAGHATEAPPAQPQSPKVQALLRSVQTHVPAPERLTAPAPAPAATAHRADAAVAPRPALSPIPAREIPITMRSDELGRVLSFSVGSHEFRISRDANGRILTASSDDGCGVRVTRRDAFGHVAGLLVTPPRGMR